MSYSPGRQLDTLRAWSRNRPAFAGRCVAHAVVVAGGKGGVGVTTTAALLAFGAAASGRNTLLVDATPSGTQLRDLLALGAGEAVEASPRYHTITRHLTLADLPDASGLTLPERRSLLRRVAARYDDHEFVVVDAGSTAEHAGAAIGAGAGRLLAVSTRDRLSIVAAYALIKYVNERFGELATSVLVNRCEPAEGTETFSRIAAGVTEFLDFEITPAGTLPDDETIRAAAESGGPAFPADAPAVAAARLLAELLLARPARRGRATVQLI